MVETDLPLLLCTLDQVLYVLYTHICYYVYYARIYSIAYTVYRLLSSCQVRIAKGQQNCKGTAGCKAIPPIVPSTGSLGSQMWAPGTARRAGPGRAVRVSPGRRRARCPAAHEHRLASPSLTCGPVCSHLRARGAGGSSVARAAGLAVRDPTSGPRK